MPFTQMPLANCASKLATCLGVCRLSLRPNSPPCDSQSDIDGKHNVADIMTKEIKDKQHFIDMASVVTSPRVYATAAAAA